MRITPVERWARYHQGGRGEKQLLGWVQITYKDGREVRSKYMKDIDEVAIKAFNIPTYFVAVAYLLVTIVLAVGVGLSVKLSDWMWLARFGAFLVCLAMMFEVTGLLKKYINRVMSIAERVTAEVVLMQIKRRPYLYGINSETSDQQINEISIKEHKRRLILTNDLIRDTILRKIHRHEFFVASVGTMLWAFADLLNKI